MRRKKYCSWWACAVCYHPTTKDFEMVSRFKNTRRNRKRKVQECPLLLVMIVLMFCKFELVFYIEKHTHKPKRKVLECPSLLVCVRASLRASWKFEVVSNTKRLQKTERTKRTEVFVFLGALRTCSVQVRVGLQGQNR